VTSHSLLYCVVVSFIQGYNTYIIFAILLDSLRQLCVSPFLFSRLSALDQGPSHPSPFPICLSSHGTFRFLAISFFSFFFATHISILTPLSFVLSLTNTSPFTFLVLKNALLPSLSFPFFSNAYFGHLFSLPIFDAHQPHLVRCYAFFLRWLLPSLLPICLRSQTSFSHFKHFPDLISSSGLSPS